METLNPKPVPIALHNEHLSPPPRIFHSTEENSGKQSGGGGRRDLAGGVYKGQLRTFHLGVSEGSTWGPPVVANFASPQSGG